jgi:hypothetical protein
MIEAAAPDGTITQAFSWLPPQAKGTRACQWIQEKHAPFSGSR